MARTESAVNSITLQAIGELPIVSKFQDLMVAATGVSSVYDVARTNMEAFVAASNMTEPQKAAIISEFYSSMIPSITNACLNAATQIVIEDRDGPYKLTKLYEDILEGEEKRDLLAAQNLKLGADIDNADNDANLKTIQGWKVQSDIARENGVLMTSMTNINSPLLGTTALGATGTKLAQENQIDASTHATIAKSLMESGNVSWSMTSPGSVTGALATTGLTAAQTKVAVRQEKGFDDNMFQHAVNGAANMAQMALSVDAFTETDPSVTYVNAGLAYLTTPTT